LNFLEGSGDPDELRRRVAELRDRAADLLRGPRFWTSVVIIAVTTLASIVGLGFLVLYRPTTVAGSVAMTGGIAYWFRRRSGSEQVSYQGLLALGGAVGGVAAEALAYLTVGVPRGAPKTPLWLVVGAVGIDGGCGLLSACCSMFPIFGLRALLAQYRARKRFVGRAA